MFKIGFPVGLEKFGIEEKEGHILLRWHGFPLAVASVWKFTGHLSFLFSCYTNYSSISSLCVFSL